MKTVFSAGRRTLLDDWNVLLGGGHLCGILISKDEFEAGSIMGERTVSLGDDGRNSSLVNRVSWAKSQNQCCSKKPSSLSGKCARPTTSA